MVVNVLAKATNDLGPAFSLERIEYALQMTLLGLGAVFAVLTLIWLILVIFKIFLYDLKNKSKKTENTENKSNVEQTVVEQPSTTVSQSSNDSTVAAIIAAISAYISDDAELSKEYANGFRVVSFKRVRPKSSWNNKNN